MNRRRIRSVTRAVAVGALVVASVVGSASAAPADDLTTAQAAIDALTAAIPGLTPVTGGGQVADVPECDGARAADALFADAGGILQTYGGADGGASAQVVVFDSTRTAKRFFRLVTNADAEACTVATTGKFTPGGGSAVADLRRGRLRRVRGSFTLRGTITVGAFVIQETEASVRRGKVVIRGAVGVVGTPTADFASIFDDWVKTTAEQF